jgi:hypothetical protein
LHISSRVWRFALLNTIRTEPIDWQIRTIEQEITEFRCAAEWGEAMHDSPMRKSETVGLFIVVFFLIVVALAWEAVALMFRWHKSTMAVMASIIIGWWLL